MTCEELEHKETEHVHSNRIKTLGRPDRLRSTTLSDEVLNDCLVTLGRLAVIFARIGEALSQLPPPAASPPEARIPSPYLTAKGAAEYLNVGYGTFRNWATKIRRTRTGRYRREDLDNFAQMRRK